jgi:hypothetical protein
MNRKNITLTLVIILVGATIGGGFVYLVSALGEGKNTDQNEKAITQSSAANSYIQSSSSSLVSSTESKIQSSSQAEVASSSIASKESFSKETGFVQKFSGWLGSNDITMELIFDKDKITGEYYNDYEQKKYRLVGSYDTEGTNQTGTISLEESDNNSKTGNILKLHTLKAAKFSNSKESADVYSTGTYNYASGVTAGLYYTNKLTTLSGFYNTNNNGSQYDLFISNDEQMTANYPIQKLEFEVAQLNTESQYDTLMLKRAESYYFTNENWKIPKDIKVGDKLSITGKIRDYLSTQTFGLSLDGQNDSSKWQPTSQGIFQITEVKKI